MVIILCICISEIFIYIGKRMVENIDRKPDKSWLDNYKITKYQTNVPLMRFLFYPMMIMTLVVMYIIEIADK